MHSSFSETSIIDLLEADPRPSFIVAPTVAPHPPTVVYTNPALSGYPALVDLVGTSKENHGPLWEWITGAPSTAPAKEGARSFLHSDVLWTKTVVHEDMIVVGANEQVPPSEQQPPEAQLDTTTRPPLPRHNSIPPPRRPVPVAANATKSEPTIHTLTQSQPDSQAEYPLAGLPIDLKEQPVSRSEGVQSIGNPASDAEFLLPDIAVLEEHPFLEVIDSVDWALTPLGPKANWPIRLEQTLTHILADSRPIAIYWGPSYTTIYNEAFSKLCGPKHPAVLGLPVQDLWNEAGQKLKQTMRKIAAGQQGSAEGEWEFFVERDSDVEGKPSWLEETFLKWSVVPIIDHGVCLGFTHSVVEITNTRVWERRVNLLVDLGENLVAARDVESYWKTIIERLAAVEPHYDIPLAILYSVEEDAEAIAAAGQPQLGPAKVCRLAGTLGVPENHPLASPTLNLRTGNQHLAYLFRDALETPHPLLVQTSDGTLPEALLEGLQQKPDLCRAAVILPIQPSKNEKVMGILLLGLNPRLPFDNSYQQFISLLSQKLTTSLASIRLLEEEAKRSQSAASQAARDQALLKEKLAAQTREANESIQLFEAVSEFVPVGMCVGDALGNLTFANDAFYKITGYPDTEPLATKGFFSCVSEEDRQSVVTEYERLETVDNVEFEFRVKMHPNSDSPLTHSPPSFEKTALLLPLIEDIKERYVLATARAERASDGSTVRVLTCLTDVTAHKRAADEAGRRAAQAENLKRMAEFATVGLYDMDLEGRLAGANNVFFKMCGLQPADLTKAVVKPFEDCVCEEDRSILTQTIETMLRENREQMAEVRLTTALTPEQDVNPGVVMPRWVQATLMPVRTLEGDVQSFTGCLSDISLQKWQFERERERREQQEYFIDMTSHELRNPMSSIVQCADAVICGLTQIQELILQNGTQASKEWHAEVCNLIANNLDTAETIVSCAEHQKRIVNDILTVSKLDSKLLAITPVTVNPVTLVEESLKMFAVEARRMDINLTMEVEQSFHDLRTTYLDFDPSRLKQVLINLLANALKFTKGGAHRNVSVAMSASISRPSQATSKVRFIPRSQESPSTEAKEPEDQERGNSVFIIFEVKDTGQGLTEEEQNNLFQRFVQASSSTHVKFGGSGLGLFISRRLTELQNGAIGVTSQPGVGSTFVFYIEAFLSTEEARREAEAQAAITKTTALTNTDSLGSFVDAGTPTSIMPPSPIAAATHNRKSRGSLASMLQSHNILLVEDNPVNQNVTKKGLESAGLNVRVANHGAECLEMLRLSDRWTPSQHKEVNADGSPRFPLSVILMDIEMPVIDGLTCTRNIRKLEGEGKLSGGRIPIIAVSANARPEQIAAAMDAGCDEVMVKPYRIPALIEKMTVLIESVTSSGAHHVAATQSNGDVVIDGGGPKKMG